jgi:hypothetical protein
VREYEFWGFGFFFLISNSAALESEEKKKIHAPSKTLPFLFYFISLIPRATRAT